MRARRRTIFSSAAGAVADEYRGQAEEAWNDASDRVRSFQEDTEQYVRENPTKAVFSALGHWVRARLDLPSLGSTGWGRPMPFRNPAGSRGVARESDLAASRR